MWLSIGVGLLAVMIYTIASFVLVRSSKSKLNKTFAYFSVLTATWIIANYIGANFKDHEISKFFIHADFFTGCLLALSFWLLTLSLLAQTGRAKKIIRLQSQSISLITAIILVVAVGTFSPFIVAVNTVEGKGSVIDYGSGYILYSVALLLPLLAGGVNMLLALRLAKGEFAYQVKTIFIGLGTAVGLVAVSNLLVPVFTTSTEVNLFVGNVSYLGIAMFIIATFYAIVKHKLFDLRLIIARTVAYVLSLGSFTAIYVGLAFLISSFFIKDYEISSQQLLVSILLMSGLIFISSPVRRYFDRKTNRIFYRDTYDSQLFLEEFNKLLVATYELEPLLKQSSEIIGENIKPAYCTFDIAKTSNRPRRLVSNGMHQGFKSEDIVLIEAEAKRIGKKMIIVDEIDDRYEGVVKVLRKNDVAILARLSATSKHDSIGYLMFGPKKSGNPYNKQDLAIIEIISNELVIAIQNSLRFEEIENFNATLQQKVDEATRKLRHANEKLKALDETKDDFISMASHQLRTPLTSIKGYISMVMEGDAGKLSKTQQDMLWQAFTSSQRMVYLIADLLNVSRLKTGKFIIEKKQINLAEVIEQELAQVDKVAAAKDVKLIYNKPKDFPELMIDDTKTRQVIMNLVDNAIYYTPSGGEVNIDLLNKPSMIEFRVKDNGIGVPKSEQHHLFGKFYRAGNARKARPDGTGLGLFMAKKVVVAQGGAIIFESKEGKGSTFGFMFSKAKLNEPAKLPAAVAVPAAERT
jgi:signal transduction histidine kinase